MNGLIFHNYIYFKKWNIYFSNKWKFKTMSLPSIPQQSKYYCKNSDSIDSIYV